MEGEEEFQFLYEKIEKTNLHSISPLNYNFVLSPNSSNDFLLFLSVIFSSLSQISLQIFKKNIQNHYHNLKNSK